MISTNHVSTLATKTYYEIFDLACLKSNNVNEITNNFYHLLSVNKILNEQEKEYCKQRFVRNIERNKERDKSGKPMTCEYCNSTRYSERYCVNCIRKYLTSQFGKWSSGDRVIDEFIQNIQLQASVPPFILEWIPPDQFEDVAYLTEGGFSKIHHAKWKRGPIMDWDEKNRKFVYEGTVDIVLKSLNEFNKRFYDEVNNYFKIKSGLCGPAENKLTDTMYGVLPYMAPELILNRQYSKASDIYSLGMLMWEIFAEYPPFYDHSLSYEKHLAYEIISGMRPPMLSKIPDKFQYMIRKCWDKDVNKRPEIEEIYKTVNEEFINVYENEELILEYENKCVTEFLEIPKSPQPTHHIRSTGGMPPIESLTINTFINNEILNTCYTSSSLRYIRKNGSVKVLYNVIRTSDVFNRKNSMKKMTRKVRSKL
ncbi:hypothetical protein RclHR1_01700017 [Rhizophagus clarus]|uniref:Kinase-like domain-containing protein n=1 Tax=Rhizophagus clarus TaxID=94130 RepID=A0A2Z6QY10_9GLOM|nr:hypothetical protein RclHR1_01700017 [Rhizophagus clarus]GES91874.1 kinase-like domain-containing protein [Rhizophagus clarus]